MSPFLRPTGNYSVGCSDIVTKLGRDRCLFRIFYPSEKDTECTEAKWLPCEEYANGYMDFLHMKPLSWAFRYLFSKTVMPALWNARLKLPNGTDKLPVIVLSHGLGGNRTTYSNICIELASHGAFVAAVEHADGSASATFYLDEGSDEKMLKRKWIPFQHVQSKDPNEHSIRNKQVHSRAKDCIKVLDHINEMNEGYFSGIGTEIAMEEFKGNLDLNKSALVGHSFGGSSAIAAASEDNRFKVAVALDPWMFPLDGQVYRKVIKIPMLFVNSETFHWTSNIACIRKYDCDTYGIDTERKIITMLGSVHQTQSDFPLLVGWTWLAQKFRLQGTSDPNLLSTISNRLVLGFIGKHLGLEFGCEVDEIVNENKSLLMFGSNVKVDEEKISQSKNKLRSCM